MIRQQKIVRIQEEAEKEAYLYVKQIKKAEKEKAEEEKRKEEDRKNSIYNEAIDKFSSEASKDIEKAEDLFSSILGWKDADEYLVKCKERKLKLEQQEKIKEEKYKRKKRKIIFAAFIVGICVGLIFGSYTFYKRVIVPQNIYESALLSIQNENYEEAIEKLNTIIGYKDAANQIDIVLEAIYTRNYADANELIAEQKYAEALEILKEMGNGEDIGALITICENALQYEEAISLAENENYREAIQILEELGDYEDSISILESYRLEADYLDAVSYANSGKNEDAVYLFRNLGDYKDAPERYNELCYQLGITAFEHLRYAEAVGYLEKVTDNEDAIEILSECELRLSYQNLYSDAVSSIRRGDLYDALEDLRQLPADYNDVAAKIELCNTYKDVVGSWICVGYEAANGTWITDEDKCRSNNFVVKIDENGSLYFVNYNYNYKDLVYTGTTLSWTTNSSWTHKLNVVTGTLAYSTPYGSFKESYTHS